MLDIGWQELLVIGVLALLVVGPKELPGLLRTVGQWAGRARSVAREFQRSMEDAAREADLTELKELQNARRDLQKMTSVNVIDNTKPKAKAASVASGGAAGATSGTNAGGGNGQAGAATPDAPPAGAPAKPAGAADSAAEMATPAAEPAPQAAPASAPPPAEPDEPAPATGTSGKGTA